MDECITLKGKSNPVNNGYFMSGRGRYKDSCRPSSPMTNRTSLVCCQSLSVGTESKLGRGVEIWDVLLTSLGMTHSHGSKVGIVTFFTWSIENLGVDTV